MERPGGRAPDVPDVTELDLARPLHGAAIVAWSVFTPSAHLRRYCGEQCCAGESRSSGHQVRCHEINLIIGDAGQHPNNVLDREWRDLNRARPFPARKIRASPKFPTLYRYQDSILAATILSLDDSNEFSHYGKLMRTPICYAEIIEKGIC